MTANTPNKLRLWCRVTNGITELCFITGPVDRSPIYNIYVQRGNLIILCLGSIGMVIVLSDLCHEGTILQRNYRKMTILWSFSFNSFVKFHGKKNREHYNISTVNPCYNEVCYKGTAPNMQKMYTCKLIAHRKPICPMAC